MNHILLNYPDKMRRKGAAGFCILLALLPTLLSCQHDDEVPAPAYEDRYVPLQISIPASEALKRSPGDPGSDARLPLPDYLYVYTAFTDVAGNTEEVLFSEYSGIRDSWTPDSTGQNVYVYSYTDQINLPLIPDATQAYCYIIASADNLSGLLSSPENLSYNEVTEKSRRAIENITLPLKAQSGDHPVSLRDLYSSYKGEANGAFAITNYGQKQSEVTGTLYHVAAKVDIQWNFSEDFHTQHPTAFLNSIILSGIPSDGFLFKPTQNEDTNGTTTLSSGFSHAGVAVYGRKDTYIWQPQNGEFHYKIHVEEGNNEYWYPNQNSSYTYTPESDDADEVAYYRLRLTIDDVPGN